MNQAADQLYAYVGKHADVKTATTIRDLSQKTDRTPGQVANLAYALKEMQN